MVGYFEKGHVYVEIEVSGIFPETKRIIKALVDTGYSGSISLSYTHAFPLALVLTGTKAYTLADESTMSCFVCIANIYIKDKPIAIAVDIQPEGDPLIGMSLLRKIGWDMKIDFINEKVEFIERTRPEPTKISPIVGKSKETPKPKKKL